MAKRGSTGSSASDPKVVAPGITEALRNVRVTTDDDDPKDAVQDTQQATEDADAERKAAGAIDVQTLLDDASAKDPAAQSGDDPGSDTGLDPGLLESLSDRLSGADLGRLVDEASPADPPPGDEGSTRRGSSMFEAGGSGSPLEDLSREGITAPGAPVAERSGEEVDKVVAGDKSQTRDGVSSIPFLGERVDDALTNAEHAAGTHAGQLNQAANSDPTTNTGSTSGSGTESGTGTQPGGTGSGGTGDSQGGGDSGDDLVSFEQDNADGSHTTVYESGDVVTTYPDGKVEHNYPDGTVETDYPDGTLKTENPDGSTETIHPDGTIDTTDPTPPPADDSGSDDSGGASGTGSDSSGTGSGSGSGGDSGSGTGSEGSGDGATSAQASGGDLGGGDPGDPESGAPLPAFLQQQIAGDLAAARAQVAPKDSGDGVTDPNPDAGEAVDTSGPIPDTKGVLLGDPIGPGAPDFGGGAQGDVGSLAGSVGGLDPTNSDPSPEADTGVQTSGPSERHVTQPTPGSFSPPTSSTGTSSDAGDESDDGGSVLSPVSPLHGVLATHLVPDNLVAADDSTDDSPDDDSDD